MASPKVEIKMSDISDEMRDYAVECAFSALKMHTIEKDIAMVIKKDFDNKYKPTWHCIAGRSFGSFVTHEKGHFIYFYVDQMAILLFKCN